MMIFASNLIAASILLFGLTLATYSLLKANLKFNWSPSLVLKASKSLVLVGILALILKELIPVSEIEMVSKRAISFPQSEISIASFRENKLVNSKLIQISEERRMSLADFVMTLFFIGFGYSLLKLLSSLSVQWRLIREAYTIKSFGRLKILCHDNIQGPYSFSSLRRKYVFLPSHLLSSRDLSKTAIYHEIQHHRQGDTDFLYLLEIIHLFFWWNPFSYFLKSIFSEIQELACDEQVIRRTELTSSIYARHLLQVAELITSRQAPFHGAVAVGMSRDGNLLKRRIQTMFNKKKAVTTRSRLIMCTFTMFFGVMALAASSQEYLFIPPSSEQLKAWAERAQVNSAFPIVINNRVLKWLNYFAGSAEGRKYMRTALLRMSVHENLVNSKIKEYGVPEELKVIPIIESGYGNPPQKRPNPSAGMWQFIESTAESFGLKVNDQIDERLDIPLATDAAMRYLLFEKSRVQKWPLAVLAYNVGGRRVQKAVQEVGSDDIWDIIDSGLEGDSDYYSKFIAGIIIMRNPESVR